ncbi:hypothetical protein [Massilia horti]|uniref:Uncharacterized protein n=1 Tax=Massilia horti TaxID=2562153 RepID=A0A4Y9SX05_9BURK|nr:hypothetical protein [Massilia horti]TFW29879.1 hypothetical protein E4O92_17845 [Massilia horti]
MKTFKIGTEQEIRNFAFSAFLFSTFGWALLEIQLLGAHARPIAHLLASVPALPLSAVSFRRCRLWWPSFDDPHDDGAKFNADRHFLRDDLCPCSALVVTGAVLAFFVNGGSIFLLGLVAGGISLVPWARIAFCNKHFFVSWTMLALGGAAVLIVGPRAQFPFQYVIGAWVLWFIALTQLLVTYRGATKVDPSGPPRMR